MSEFEAGVFVDLDEVNDPLFNEDIKKLLNTTLDSLANNKEEEYRNVFRDKKTANAYMYLLGKDYRFDEIGTIEEDNEGRIVVELRGKEKDDTGIKTPNAYYYFVKNDQNQFLA